MMKILFQDIKKKMKKREIKMVYVLWDSDPCFGDDLFKWIELFLKHISENKKGAIKLHLFKDH